MNAGKTEFQKRTFFGLLPRYSWWTLSERKGKKILRKNQPPFLRHSFSFVTHNVHKSTTYLTVPVCVCAGVCQLVNKMDEASGSVRAFNRNDEQFLEAFAIFCGLGIQNTQMYETVERAMAKQEVTLEVSLTNAGA